MSGKGNHQISFYVPHEWTTGAILQKLQEYNIRVVTHSLGEGDATGRYVHIDSMYDPLIGQKFRKLRNELPLSDFHGEFEE